jgi:hypothetical protein
MTYKLLGVDIDPEHKDYMRDLILKNKTYNEDQKKQIIDYCLSDISELNQLLSKVFYWYEKKLPTRKNTKDLLGEILYRGESVVRSALIECYGYPIKLDEAKNFASNVPSILREIQEDINSQFDWEIFSFQKKTGKYKENVKELREYVMASEYADKWPKTDTGKPSLSLPSLERMFGFKHNYPKGSVFAQITRYKKYKQNLNGFLPKDVTAKNRKTLFSYVNESTSRVHPYLNPYGSQSARFQPSATGFINLKSAIFRGLTHPAPGRVLVSCDYGSEEFLIGALLSRDVNMLRAYKSGDVYLYFAKLAGAVPWDGTKKEYARERNVFKSTTLGLIKFVDKFLGHILSVRCAGVLF